jgi:hypothetical protein
MTVRIKDSLNFNIITSKTNFLKELLNVGLGNLLPFTMPQMSLGPTQLLRGYPEQFPQQLLAAK